MQITPVKRALISVSDKAGIADFAKQLHQLNIEIISTGGTSQALREAGIPHRQVDALTGLPAMLDGRVKTLHPKVHGGILGRRDDHATEASQHGIEWIDLVVVNFYPFADAVKSLEMPWEEVVEYIDIGGPTMVRAAAKNFAWVGVVTDPADYESVMADLRTHAGLTGSLKTRLAGKAFGLTSRYDAMINDYFLRKENNLHECPEEMTLRLTKSTELRYGENPHQKACAYQLTHHRSGILSAKQHQGKPLSYNNILDSEAAYTCVNEFSAPSCVIVKHANPCGVASAATINDAYQRAYEADAVSAFGGIVALNRPCTLEIATAIANIFMEVVLAPAYTPEALAEFAKKPNLRVLEMPQHAMDAWEFKYINGGFLRQEKDQHLVAANDLKFVTKVKCNNEDVDAMLFAWRVIKHIKSNGILIAKNNMTVGIGAGQVSRIDSVDIAVRKAGAHTQNAILASDAFFPFRDGIDRLANTGIRAIIQPGGSVRDDEVIAACDEYGIAMAFTGKRCFRH
jgi:phosphoribosylaminoimidazolecarboxamide formyltransferase/IMP cyclohydrolase